MGSFLSKPRSQEERRTDLPQRPAPCRPSQALHQIHRVQHVHRAHPAPRLRPATRPRNWDLTNPALWGVNEAWRRFPMNRPQNSIVGSLPSDWRESYFQRTIWSLRHPRAVWSPVTIKITPLERRGLPATSTVQAISLVGPSFSEKPAGQRAKETVFRVLRECKKGRLRLEEPPSPSHERSESNRNPNAIPSAFKPLTKRGNLTSFLPSLGPLKRSLDSWNSDHSLNRRPCSSSTSSLVSSHTAGCLSSQRNAIASSYSSSKDCSKPWKRNVPCVSLQMPEWPVKKNKGRQSHSPVPRASQEPPAASGSTGQQNEETPWLPSSPATLLSQSPPPQLGFAVPAEELTLGMKAGPQWRNKTRKDDTTEVTTNLVADNQSAVPPAASLTLPSAGIAPIQGTNPQVASPGSLFSPQSTGEVFTVAHSPLKTPSLLAPSRCSLSEALPGPPSDSKLAAAVTLLAPVFPTLLVTDTTRPPLTCQAERSARPADPLSTQRALFGMVRRPACHLSASAPPAATSADPTSKPILGPPPNSETGNSLPSRVSITAVARSPLDISVPTFKPTFRSTRPRKTIPMTAPFSFKQTSLPAPPASTHLFRDLVKATSVAMSTTPASTSKGSSFKPPPDFSVAVVTSAKSSIYSVHSSSHTFLFGASSTFRASFSPVTGFILPSNQQPPIPMISRDIFSQVLFSAVQTPSKSTANFKGKVSPLSPSTLVTTSQPALSSGISGLTSAFTVPLGSSSKPPFPVSLGATSQPACEATGMQKQGVPQSSLGPSSNSSSILGSSALASPTPTPLPTLASVQPALSSPTQSAFGGLTRSTSTSHIPVSLCSDVGSTPAGFPSSQASATGFGVVNQTHESGACGSVFGSTAPQPFAFGGLVTPMDCGESRVSMTVPDMSSNSGVLSIGTIPKGATHTTVAFGKGWSQNTQGLTSQNTPFTLGRASISARKIMFGAPPVTPLAQSTPVSRSVKTNSSFGFGIPSVPVQASTGGGSFRSSAPLFSIGANPKPLKIWEKGHSRRHHAHKK